MKKRSIWIRLSCVVSLLLLGLPLMIRPTAPVKWYAFFFLPGLLLLMAPGFRLWADRGERGSLSREQNAAGPLEPAPAGEGAPEWLLLFHNASGKTYQVFSGERGYLFHQVAGTGRALREKSLLDRCPSPEEFDALPGTNFIVKRSSVVQAYYSRRRASGGILSLWSPQKRCFLLLEELQGTQVQRFFEDLGPRMKLDPRTAEPSDEGWRELRRKDPIRFRLRSAWIALCALGGASSGLFLFLTRPYALWSGLCILCWAASVLLLLAFPEQFSPSLRREDPIREIDDKILALVGPVMAAGAGPGLRSLRDFNFVSFWPVVLAGLLLSLLLLALFCLRYPELRRRFYALIGVWSLLLAFSSGVPAQLNHLLDDREPERMPAEIVDKSVESGARGWVSFALTVRLPDGTEMDLDTSRSVYSEAQVGDRGNLEIHPGALGMPYAVFAPAG